MKKKIKIILKSNSFFFESESDFSSLESKGFGFRSNQCFQLHYYEVLFLLNLGKIDVFNIRNQNISFEKLKLKPFINYDLFLVYSDLRSKGYYLGSGLKFGSDFRVYEKGHKKDESHSKWLVKVIRDSKKLSLRDYASSIRISTSTKKKLLIAIIDIEDSINYYESSWVSIT